VFDGPSEFASSSSTFSGIDQPFLLYKHVANDLTNTLGARFVGVAVEAPVADRIAVVVGYFGSVRPGLASSLTCKKPWPMSQLCLA
jgi:hypothetical protein